MFQVRKSKCDQCLFSKNKIVSDARKKDILSQCKKEDTHFNCHKAQLKGGKIPVCCRGFYNTATSNLIRISQRLNMVKEVE